MKPLKIIFAGTPEFAAPTLRALIHSPHEVCAVYTQPDKPAGRGRQLVTGPIKQMALAAGLPIHQPKTLKDPVEQEIVRNYAPDLMIVVAYGLILPQVVLDIPQYGCINVHASLLPRWRGAAPIQRAIATGDALTGVSIMQMEAGLDTGPVLKMESCPILMSDTSKSLHDKLAELGATCLLATLEQLPNIKAIPQSNEGITIAPKIEKAEGLIDWQQAADSIERLIRAFNPWPICYTHLGELPLRVWDAIAINQNTSANPGTILELNKEGIDIATGKGILRIRVLQFPGGKPLPVKDVLHSKTEIFAKHTCLY